MNIKNLEIEKSKLDTTIDGLKEVKKKLNLDQNKNENIIKDLKGKIKNLEQEKNKIQIEIENNIEKENQINQLYIKHNKEFIKLLKKRNNKK